MKFKPNDIVKIKGTEDWEQKYTVLHTFTNNEVEGDDLVSVTFRGPNYGPVISIVPVEVLDAVSKTKS